MGGALKEKLDAYVAAGGKLIASGKSTLPMNLASPDCDFAYDLGATWNGTRTLIPSYVVPSEDMDKIPTAGYVEYATTERATLREGGVELACTHEPYFNRTAAHFCSHMHAPEKPEYAGVGVSAGKHGIYIASAIFREYAMTGSLISKRILMDAIDRLLGEDKTVSVGLPSQGNVTLMDQTSENRVVLHLLYAPRIAKGSQKIEVIEDCVPLYNIPVTMKLAGKTPKKVYTAPDGEAIRFTVDQAGSISFTVPEIRIHSMVVVDY